MLRIGDVLSLNDTTDINKSPGVVVIHVRGLKELEDGTVKHGAKMYNLSFTKLSSYEVSGRLPACF